MKKHLISLALIALLILPVLSLSLAGQAKAELDVGLDEVENEIELGNTDPRTMIASIINVAMGFLGIIAVVIILAGGFKWMTAAGNEDKVSEAKKLLASGVIGLVIVLSAWAIAQFVVSQLVNATTA